MKEPEEEKPGYEKRDFDPKAMGILAATLVLGLIFSSLVVGIFYVALSLSTQKEEGPILPSIQKAWTPFPEPQLQTAPTVDLAKFRRQEAAALNEYRWIDRKAGVVAIPIDRAMELLVKEGGPPVLGQPGLPEGSTWPEMLQRRAEEGAAERAKGVAP